MNFFFFFFYHQRPLSSLVILMIANIPLLKGIVLDTSMCLILNALLLLTHLLLNNYTSEQLLPL